MSSAGESLFEGEPSVIAFAVPASSDLFYRVRFTGRSEPFKVRGSISPDDGLPHCRGFLLGLQRPGVLGS